MENLTHSLVGAAIAQAALDEDAPVPVRRTMIAAGVFAANAPDLDLLYTWITPAPIGYLLHHRGHTHTIAGVVALSVAIAAIWNALPSARRDIGRRARLAVVIGAGVASHLLLDAGNSYGVHPFYPFDNRWYYGDSLFIFEPLLWLALGGTVAMNARSPLGGWLGAGTVTGLSIATGVLGIVPWPALIASAAIAGGTGLGTRRLRPSMRALAALAGVAVFAGAMFGLSRVARGVVMRALPAAPGAARLDVVLTPSPAFPLCWSAIAIDLDEAGGVMRLRRGAVSLAPRVLAARDCPLERLAGADSWSGTRALAIYTDIRVPLAHLRAGAAGDCRISAWLCFVRAPVITPTRAYDLRYERAGGAGNFTTMAIGPSANGCPSFVPDWTMPRADALEK